MRRRLGATFLVLALALGFFPGLLAADDRDQEPRGEIPPKRVVAELVTTSRAGFSRLTLFSNGIAVLKRVPAQEDETVESRLLSEEEMVVYQREIDGIVSRAGSSGEGSLAGDKNGMAHRLSVTTSSGGAWTWSWGQHELAPTSAVELVRLIDDLRESVAERWESYDPWAEVEPRVGERVIRVDGVVFVITAYDPLSGAIHLKAENQPLVARSQRDHLSLDFLPELAPTGMIGTNPSVLLRPPEARVP